MQSGESDAFSIEEGGMKGDYKTSYSENSTNDTTTVTVTNTYKPESTNHSVTKIWNDADDNDGVRPDSIEVTLKAFNTIESDASEEAQKQKILVHTYDESTNTYKNAPEDFYKHTITKENYGNPYSWNNLPKNYRKDGKTYEITYTVEETSISVENSRENYETPVVSEDGS